MNNYKIKRNQLNLSQQDLADQAGVTRQVVQKTESYLYNQPPPSLTNALVRLCRASQIAATAQQLEAGYRAGQLSHRRASKTAFNLSSKDWDQIKSWRDFRSRVSNSQYGFAGLLAYDLGKLQLFEKDGSGAESLLLALSEVLEPERLKRLECIL